MFRVWCLLLSYLGKPDNEMANCIIDQEQKSPFSKIYSILKEQYQYIELKSR